VTIQLTKRLTPPTNRLQQHPLRVQVMVLAPALVLALVLVLVLVLLVLVRALALALALVLALVLTMPLVLVLVQPAACAKRGRPCTAPSVTSYSVMNARHLHTEKDRAPRIPGLLWC
jgi:hypothetical protein